MNTIAVLFLVFNLNAVLITLGVISAFIFYWWFYYRWVPEHNRRVRGVDFPQPILIEKWIPDREGDPNRMLLTFKNGFKIKDPKDLRTQLYLTFNYNAGRVSVDMFYGDGIHWIRLRKKSDEEWEQVLLEAEKCFKIFFERSIEFYEKKVEKVASG